MQRNLENFIMDAMTDIISLLVENDLPRTADVLREARLLMLLELCQNPETDVTRDAKCRLSQNV
jgi:hypothetical protein